MAVIDTTFVPDAELLVQVKSLLDYGENEYADTKLNLLINGVKQTLLGSGVSEKVVNSVSAVEVIAYMVDDIQRKVGMSDYVQQKITQLRMVDYE